MGVQDLGHVVRGRVSRIAPVEQRVVRPEHEVVALAGRGVVGHDVALWPAGDHRAVGVRRIPPRPAVVVFGDQHGVAGARVDCELRPGLGVEGLVGEQRQEVVVVLDVPPTVAMMGQHLHHRAGMQQDVGDVLAQVAPVPVGVLADR